MSFKRLKCYECGSLMALKPYTHIEQVGPVEVSDSTRHTLTCAACGETPLTDNKLQWYELRSAAAVLRDGTNVTPEVITYARKALGLTYPEFKAYFGSDSICGTRLDQLELASVLDGVASGQFLIRDYIAKWSGSENSSFLQLKRATSIQLLKTPICENCMGHCTICRKQTPHKWESAENTYFCTICGEAQR